MKHSNNNNYKAMINIWISNTYGSGFVSFTTKNNSFCLKILNRPDVHWQNSKQKDRSDLWMGKAIKNIVESRLETVYLKVDFKFKGIQIRKIKRRRKKG